jgi:hypothetical protein
LKLNNSIILTSNDGLTFQDLDLNGYSLTLGSATSDLTVTNAVTLDADTEQIISGDADLTLTGGLTVTQGKISTSSGTGGGTIRLGNVSTVAAGGILDLPGSTLILDAGLSVLGTLVTDGYSVLTHSIPHQESKCFQANQEFLLLQQYLHYPI